MSRTRDSSPSGSRVSHASSVQAQLEIQEAKATEEEARLELEARRIEVETERADRRAKREAKRAELEAIRAEAELEAKRAEAELEAKRAEAELEAKRAEAEREDQLAEQLAELEAKRAELAAQAKIMKARNKAERARIKGTASSRSSMGSGSSRASRADPEDQTYQVIDSIDFDEVPSTSRADGTGINVDRGLFKDEEREPVRNPNFLSPIQYIMEPKEPRQYMNDCAQKAKQVKVHASDYKALPISGYGNTDHNPVQDKAQFVPSDRRFFRELERPDNTGEYVPDSRSLDFAKTMCDAFALPKVSVSTFDGNPLKFHQFMTNFKVNIDKRSLPPETKLAYLVQMCAGKAQQAIESCTFIMPPSVGYSTAVAMLHRRFGERTRVVDAHIGQITDGPTLKGNDTAGLNNLATQMQNCMIVLKEWGYSSSLDSNETLKKIFYRFPVHLQNEYFKVVKAHYRRGGNPTFASMMEFIEDNAVMTNTFFGQLVAGRETKVRVSHPKTAAAENTKPKWIPRASTFSTISTSKENGETPARSAKANYNRNLVCPSCKNNHGLWKCQEFLDMSRMDRRAFVRSKRLCYNCLRGGHIAASCEWMGSCQIVDCDGRHNTLLHIDYEQAASTPNSQGPEPSSGAGINVTSGGINCETSPKVRMKVVPVTISHPKAKDPVCTYAFLDEGSNHTLCTRRLVEKLGLEGKREQYVIETTNGLKRHDGLRISLTVKGVEECQSVEIQDVLALETIPNVKSSIPTNEDVERYVHLYNLEFPKIEKQDIDLLVGAEVLGEYPTTEVKKGRKGQPNAHHTVFGWTLFGLDDRLGDERNASSNFIQVKMDDKNLHQQMQQMYRHDFMDLEDDPLTTELSVEDKRALSIMDKTVTTVDGHFQIGLPWKSNTVDLPPSRHMAEKRLWYLKQKFQRDPVLFQKYRDKINDYLQEGYARVIPKDMLSNTNKTWYIPHHATGSKFRVVFDCAAKSRGTSINQELLQGPDLTNSLIGVLLRFRQEPIAFVADIRAMFHQVKVKPEDCDGFRFLWWPEGDYTKESIDHQMQVHVFGAVSSPSIASYALKKVASDNICNSSSQAVQTVKQNFYVDDCLKAVRSTEEAVQLIKELSQLLGSGGFHITKFRSNHDKVTKSVAEEDRGTNTLDLDLDNVPIERALGVHWNMKTDNFEIRVDIKSKPPTRRGLLSMVSQIFDPLGFVQPYVLPMKQLMQELTENQLTWDEDISGTQLERWEKWVEMLPHLQSIVVPRCFKPSGFEAESAHLHCFCDASQKGYGAVAYLRMVSKDGTVHCSFVKGTSRVTPLKPVTIPRLELTSAVIAVKLARLIRRELEYDLGSITFWTDSTSVLQFISNTTRRFQTFVANRITMIRKLSHPEQWRHVRTTDNPADIASRGLMPDKAKRKNCWLTGPTFLWEDESAWPERVTPPSMDSDDPELKREAEVNSIAVNPSNDSLLDRLLTRYSSYGRLQRAVAWVIRLYHYLRWKFSPKFKDQPPQRGFLTASEMEQATLQIVKLVQKEVFAKEVASLYDHTSLHDKIQLKSKRELTNSPLRKLSPFVVQGVLYVGGRLQKAPIEITQKHQIILPSSHYVTELLIKDYHEREGHSGTLHILNCMRERFWILKGQASVRRVLHRCMDCRCRTAKACEQWMAPLPTARVTPGNSCFTSTAIDYMGPLLTKVGRSQVKRYCCVMTCMATRAVHLEVACALDTSSFIKAFRRFTNRRGRPAKVYSDNGTNFVGAERELGEGIQRWNQAQINKALCQQGIQWNFIPPRAAHQGGVYERMVRSVKKILRALIGERILDDESLYTFLVEVERILNDRPLSPVSDDHKDFRSLTPNSLLIGRLDPELPPDEFIRADGYKKSWRKIQWLADEFWRRWVKEYMPLLQLRQKWLKPVRNLKVGDFVLLMDENRKRGLWPKAVVEETYADNDGMVRRARVRTADATYYRDIRKLCLLEAVI